MRALSGLAVVSVLLAAVGCAGGASTHQRIEGVPSGEIGPSADEAYDLVRDPERFENEVSLKVYDIRGLYDDATDLSAGRVIRSVVELCARADKEQIVEERRGKLVVLAARRTHAIVAAILQELMTHPEDWVWTIGAKWREPFERAVSGATSIIIRHRAPVARITTPAEVETLIRRLEFRDSYSGIDYEMKVGPCMDFLGNGEVLASIEYVTYDGGVRLRWERGPWRGCATLTGESSAFLIDFLKRKGVAGAMDVN
ncbi:MAG: hypothetical protein ACYTFI_20565, partial [Planctomycetota bacterium]